MPAWICTLGDAIAFSNRLSIATEPYLSIPGEVIDDLDLEDKRRQLLEQREKLERQIEHLLDKEASLLVLNNSDNPPRRSNRLQQENAREEVNLYVQRNIIDEELTTEVRSTDQYKTEEEEHGK